MTEATRMSTGATQSQDQDQLDVSSIKNCQELSSKQKFKKKKAKRTKKEAQFGTQEQQQHGVCLLPVNELRSHTMPPPAA